MFGEWVFAIYMMGQYPKIAVEVFIQPTKVKCVSMWREKVEQFKITHPKAIITSCEETKGLIAIKSPLKNSGQQGG